MDLWADLSIHLLRCHRWTAWESGSERRCTERFPWVVSTASFRRTKSSSKWQRRPVVIHSTHVFVWSLWDRRCREIEDVIGLQRGKDALLLELRDPGYSGTCPAGPPYIHCNLFWSAPDGIRLRVQGNSVQWPEDGCGRQMTVVSFVSWRPP